MTRTYRRPYRQSRRFDRTCRSHGSCPWCKRNRLHNDHKRRLAWAQDLRDWYEFR